MAHPRRASGVVVRGMMVATYDWLRNAQGLDSQPALVAPACREKWTVQFKRP